MERAREFGRRARRLAESRRRPLLALLVVAFLALYLAPTALRTLLGAGEEDRDRDPRADCYAAALRPFADALRRRDAARWSRPGDSPLAPLVGDGLFVVSLPEARTAVRTRASRTPSSPIGAPPLPDAAGDFAEGVEYVTDYAEGVAHRFQCSALGVGVHHAVYARRTGPSLLVHEVRVSNPTAVAREVRLDTPEAARGRDALTPAGRRASVRLSLEGAPVAFALATDAPRHHTAEVPPGGAARLEFRTAIVSREGGDPDALARTALARLDEAASAAPPRAAHVQEWRRLWETGVGISESLAADAINGDRINATLYAVLSHAAAAAEGVPVLGDGPPAGCYEGHPTLDAADLWRPLSDAERTASVASAWLLTLERRGCHDLLAAGPRGVAQAMTLSLGGFRFSARHLEFGARPSDLHRDFDFRRIAYGPAVVNVSVVVEEDNKAAIRASADGGRLFACDAGCLDGPVALGPSPKRFPVKRTDPPTAVLYVSPDEAHLDDLRHALHVKEVAVAPPHERHVIALHRHGHALGGLPTAFWASVCLLIVVFHLFLCRIVMTEYCDPPDRYRRLYDKPR